MDQRIWLIEVIIICRNNSYCSDDISLQFATQRRRNSTRLDRNEYIMMIHFGWLKVVTRLFTSFSCSFWYIILANCFWDNECCDSFFPIGLVFCRRIILRSRVPCRKMCLLGISLTQILSPGSLKCCVRAANHLPGPPTEKKGSNYKCHIKYVIHLLFLFFFFNFLFKNKLIMCWNHKTSKVHLGGCLKFLETLILYVAF